jgi:hypothetical protein
MEVKKMAKTKEEKRKQAQARREEKKLTHISSELKKKKNFDGEKLVDIEYYSSIDQPKHVTRKKIRTAELEMCVPTKINRHSYLICKHNEYDPWNGKHEGISISARPVTKGDVATSRIDFNSYEYTHGGATFRDAVDLTKEIKKRM